MKGVRGLAGAGTGAVRGNRRADADADAGKRRGSCKRRACRAQRRDSARIAMLQGKAKKTREEGEDKG